MIPDHMARDFLFKYLCGVVAGVDLFYYLYKGSVLVEDEGLADGSHDRLAVRSEEQHV